MLTATTLALPQCTNIPRPTKKNPKDTPNRVFNKLAWHQNYGTEGVYTSSAVSIIGGHSVGVSQQCACTSTDAHVHAIPGRIPALNRVQEKTD